MRSLRTATKSSPHSLQLEKACMQQQRPKAAKKKPKKQKTNNLIKRGISSQPHQQGQGTGGEARPHPSQDSTLHLRLQLLVEGIVDP